MKLRQAKKIFNRVAAYESDLLREFPDETDDQTLKLFHVMATAFCGYADRQVDAACNRLGRHLNRHPNFRPEFLAK